MAILVLLAVLLSACSFAPAALEDGSLEEATPAPSSPSVMPLEPSSPTSPSSPAAAPVDVPSGSECVEPKNDPECPLPDLPCGDGEGFCASFTSLDCEGHIVQTFVCARAPF